MKIIDLLNKIANGEEVPKKIRLKGKKWDYDEEFNGGLYTDGMGTFAIYGNELLKEVEILDDERKKFTKEDFIKERIDLESKGE